MRNHIHPTTQALLRQGLIGLALVGAVAVFSLPAARGAGPLGWTPMWLLGMPLAALAALVLADLRERQGREARRLVPAGRRRARPVQARRRAAARTAMPRRRAAA